MMDPDIVREQEEAERAAAGLAPKKPVNGSARPIQSRHAPSEEPVQEPITIGLDPVSEKKPAASATLNPNRRALPPVGKGRSSDEEPAPRRRVGGLLRLFLYAAGGAVVGAILGFVGVNYFEWYQAQAELFISSMAGGGALLFGLMHLLHYDV